MRFRVPVEYVGYLWMVQQALRSMQKYDAVKQVQIPTPSEGSF